MFESKVIPFTDPRLRKITNLTSERRDRRQPPRAPNPQAHCYAIPRPNARNEPPGHYWLLIVPQCPHCGGQHTHGGGTSDTWPVPFNPRTRSDGHRVPHCNPGQLINRRKHDREREYRLAEERIQDFAQYELIVDLPLPLKEWKQLPEHLGFYALMVQPANAAAIALDSEVY